MSANSTSLNKQAVAKGADKAAKEMDGGERSSCGPSGSSAAAGVAKGEEETKRNLEGDAKRQAPDTTKNGAAENLMENGKKREETMKPGGGDENTDGMAGTHSTSSASPSTTTNAATANVSATTTAGTTAANGTTTNASAGGQSSISNLLSTELRLQYVWHIWEQVVPQKDHHVDYSDNTKAIASFKTVQEFWRLWNYMPQPSELLNSKRMVREADDALHLVDALMIFKEGVEPMWEDPLNAKGGHFEYKLSRNVPGPQIDEYWNNLVLGMIGGNLDEGELVTGVRLVDKLNSGRGSHGCIRIEVWFTNFEEHKKKDSLKKSVEKCMATHLDGTFGTLPIGDVKGHKCKT